MANNIPSDAVVNDETARIMSEYFTVLHNRMSRCKTTNGKLMCQKRTTAEYMVKLEMWIVHAKKGVNK